MRKQRVNIIKELTDCRSAVVELYYTVLMNGFINTLSAAPVPRADSIKVKNKCSHLNEIY